MIDVKEIVYDILNDNAELRVLLGGEDRIGGANQPIKLVKPCVTFGLSSSDKKISDVKEIWTLVYSVVVWSVLGDEECDLISDSVYSILDQGLVSNSKVLIQGCDVFSMAGPYWDPEQKSWRKDIRFEIIAQLK